MKTEKAQTDITGAIEEIMREVNVAEPAVAA
jgi:hypothetical protein